MNAQVLRIVQTLPLLADNGQSSADGRDFLLTSWETVRKHLSVEAIPGLVSAYGPAVIQACLVFLIGRIIARVFSGMIVRACRKARVDETLGRFLGNVAYAILLTAVSIVSLTCLGVDTTSLSAVLAATGFAIAMALQGSLGNVASGVMLVFLKPFRVGDMIEVGGVQGQVVEVQIFNTVLKTPDNVRIIMPNSGLTNGTIRNLSAEPTRRIDLTVTCGYNDDLRDVRRLLEDIVRQESRVLSDPSPVIAVSELADSGVNFVVRPWVRSADFNPVRFALTEQIKLGFDEHGFTIPFPSRDVFVHHLGQQDGLTDNLRISANAA